MMYRHGMRSSGNSAFDAFLRRLREAKGKTEFDAFMEDRTRAARADQTPQGEDSPRA